MQSMENANSLHIILQAAKDNGLENKHFIYIQGYDLLFIWM